MNLAKKLLMTTGTSSGTVPTPSGGYVDDVFSAFTYTGNSSTQTINNGIDLAGEGGLVWIKGRSGATDHALYDTARGATLDLVSNSTAGQITQSTGLTTFGNSGFSVGSLAKLNTNLSTYASWTFRKAPKFFDVVTFSTGSSGSGGTVNHSLGQTPGMVVFKRTTGADGMGWLVWHRSLSTNFALFLNSTPAEANQGVDYLGPTATTLSPRFLEPLAHYATYLFAHDTSADGIIQCGSFTGNTTVNIGWEPQWIMIKRTDATGDWIVIDSMRGCSVGGVDAVSNPNLLNVESVSDDYIDFTATGFITKNLTGTHIYTVIRRPNKPPTSGTQVYNAIAYSGSGTAGLKITGAGFPPDLLMTGSSDGNFGLGRLVYDRLRGPLAALATPSVGAEPVANSFNYTLDQDGNTIDPTYANLNNGGKSYINHFFRRAPGFFDVVCYTGDGTYGRNVKHNLGVVPELVIVKSRNGVADWYVNGPFTNWVNGYPTGFLNKTDQLVGNTNTGVNNPTATTFGVIHPNTNSSSGSVNLYVAYLFATLAGISKVGSYSGNGSTQTIPCGFTTGSRFVLIKRTDNTGDWFVWDTARGITPTTDPHLSLNTIAAEVTTDDSIDQDASGFVVNQNAATNINALGGNYLFLAIA